MCEHLSLANGTCTHFGCSVSPDLCLTASVASVSSCKPDLLSDSVELWTLTMHAGKIYFSGYNENAMRVQLQLESGHSHELGCFAGHLELARPWQPSD